MSNDEFLNQRHISGNAFVLLREADLFLKRHLPVSGRFESGRLERIDEPLFPPLALREALANALCHRDYSIYVGATNVAIYDDRVEIISTGTLPFGLTVADLTREHESRPRNPYLADVFYRRGLIERWGRGTLKIIEMCRMAGRPAPEFEQRAGDLVVRFRPNAYSPPTRASHNLTERQRRILMLLSDGLPQRSGEIRNQFDPPLAKTTLGEELDLLRTLGLVLRTGHGAGARWHLRPPETAHQPDKTE